MAIKFQTRRGSSSNWSNTNPILAAGEIGFETDTYKLKVGTGSNTWNTLDYIAKRDAWVSVTDYGADPTGLTDSTNAIANAISRVSSAGGGVVFFPAGTYATNTGIVVGNGNDNSISTKDHKVRLVGESYGSAGGVIDGGFSDGFYVKAPSRILYTGSEDATKSVVTFNGPLVGIGMENIGIECDSKAGRGVLFRHVTQGTFNRVSVRNYIEVGYFLTTVNGFPSGCVFGNADNRFYDCYAFLDAISGPAWTNDIKGIILHSGVQPWRESITFSNSGGDILGTYTTDIASNSKVHFTSSGSLPAGLLANTAYFTVRQSATTSKFATSEENSGNNIVISWTSGGSGSNTITKSLEGAPDSARNIFIGGTYFYGNTFTSHGAWLCGADNNAFFEVQFYPSGYGSGAPGRTFQGYDVYFEPWFLDSSSAFPNENYFCNLGMPRGISGYNGYGSGGGNTFFPHPTSDSGGGSAGLTSITGVSGRDHIGTEYIRGTRAYRGRQIIQAGNSASNSTNSASYIDIPGYSVNVTTFDSTKLKIEFSGLATKTTAGTGFFIISVDGNEYSQTTAGISNGPDGFGSVSSCWIQDVNAGSHTIKVRYRSDDGNSLAINNGVLIVQELF